MYITVLIAWLLSNLISSSSEPGKAYFSADSGKHWKRIDKGIPADADITDLASNGNQVFAATYSHGLFVMNSKIADWSPLEIDGVEFDNWIPASNGLPSRIQINVIELVKDRIMIGCREVGVYYTDNQGKTWISANKGLQNLNVRCLYAAGAVIYAGTDMGLFTSKDRGASWQHSFGEMQINGITSDGKAVYVAHLKGLVVSENGGQTWTSWLDEVLIHGVVADGKLIYALQSENGIIKTANKGQSWESANNGVAKLSAFELKSHHSQLLGAFWEGFYFSDSNGEEWTKRNQGIPDTLGITNMAVSNFGIVVGTQIRGNGC